MISTAIFGLKHSALHLVNLVLETPNCTPMQQVYVADPQAPFHRLEMNSNSSPALQAGSHFGVQAAVSFSPHKSVSLDGLEGRVLAATRDMGIAGPDERLVGSSAASLPYAYSVYTR